MNVYAGRINFTNTSRWRPGFQVSTSRGSVQSRDVVLKFAVLDVSRRQSVLAVILHELANDEAMRARDD